MDSLQATLSRLRCLPLFSFLLLAAATTPGLAQVPCADALREAEKSYHDGNVLEVFRLRSTCLAGRPSRSEKIQAYELLAKAYVAVDDPEHAAEMIARLVALAPDFEPGPSDPLLFAESVQEAKRQAGGAQVSSVSKTNESLREAPATVIIITGEEIERRGYLDLEALLHDLPGFDISRSNGLIYSHIYQRGLRSDANSRTLLLVDGVEENELWSQSMFIGRTYPLSNIERVEVIYGPASTIYGSNALAGVISIITKQPESFIQDGRRIGVKVVSGAGSLSTRYFDGTVAGRTKDGILSWSLTSRIFQADESYLSRYPAWDFDPAGFETFYYQGFLRIDGSDRVQDWFKYLWTNQLNDCSDDPDCYYTVNDDSVELTELGMQRAIELDQAAYSQELMGRPIAFSDPTDDRYLAAKIKLSNLLLGVMSWDYQEGLGGSYTDLAAPGGKNGMAGNVEVTSLYTRYSRSIGSDVSLDLFARYKLHEYGAVLTSLRSYSNRSLGLQDLVLESSANWLTKYYHASSSQFRTELNATYSPSERFNLVGGIDYRNGLIQRNWVASEEPNPAETGSVLGPSTGDNHLRTTDMGVFARASYKPWRNLKVVFSGRLGRNEVGENLGHGTDFIPHLALVYSRGAAVFKAIWSKWSQPVPNSQIYAAASGEDFVTNPDLRPERIETFELSAAWQSGDHLAMEVSAYNSILRDVVEMRVCAEPECGASRSVTNVNAGTGESRGIQGTVSWKYKNSTLTGNYTYSDPFTRDPRGFNGEPLIDPEGNPIARLRTGDIADHQVNLHFGTRLWKKIDLNLRANYVGPKRTGSGTTVSWNPYSEFDSYFVANAALTYKNLWSGLSLQLAVNNLFDEEYYHPGIGTADGVYRAARIPQQGRGIYVRLLLSL